MSQYTLIIPTRNRPEFIVRSLRYYQDCGIAAPIIVADGSDPADLETNTQTVEAFRNKGLNVRLFSQQNPLQIGSMNMGFMERLHRCIQTIDTPCVHIISDDDFIGSRYLQESSSYLLAYPDYSSVFGVICGIYLDDQRASTSPYGIVDRLDIVRPSAAISHHRASDRLAAFQPGYGALFYTMHRTENLREALEKAHLMTSWITAKSIPAEDEAAAELILDTLQGWLLNYMTLANGKIHSIPYLNMANHYHGDNWGQKIIATVGVADSYSHPLWPPLLEIFIASVANIVARNDDIEPNSATHLVSSCIWRLVGGRLTHCSNEFFNAFAKTAGVSIPEPVWRSRLRKIPLLQQSIRALRKFRRIATEKPLQLTDVPELQLVIDSIERH